MADPNWIKKTLLFALVLVAPSLMLLASVWRHRTAERKTILKGMPGFWIAIVFLAIYAGWFLNVTFEWSVGVMVAGPIFCILLSLLGCGISLAAGKADRVKLIGANALLFVLSLSSIVAPN